MTAIKSAVLTGRTVNVKPSTQPLKVVTNNDVNRRRPAPEQRRADQANQKFIDSLKQENSQLKKGLDNTQIMSELKYVRSQVESLKKSLAARDVTIAEQKREIAALKEQLAPDVKPAGPEDVAKAEKILAETKAA